MSSMEISVQSKIAVMTSYGLGSRKVMLTRLFLERGGFNSYVLGKSTICCRLCFGERIFTEKGVIDYFFQFLDLTDISLYFLMH